MTRSSVKARRSRRGSAAVATQRGHPVYRGRSLKHRIPANRTDPTRRSAGPRVRGGQSVSATPALDTFPRLLLHHAATRGRHPATREKDLGIWQTWTWAQVEDEVRALACGLAAQGFKRGMNLAIIGDNRPRLYWSMAAAQALGGVPVPLYQDAVADGDGLRAERRRSRTSRSSRTRSRSTSCSRSATAARRSSTSSSTTRAGCATTTQDFLHGYDGIQAMGRARARGAPGLLRATRWRRGAPTTWR